MTLEERTKANESVAIIRDALAKGEPLTEEETKAIDLIATKVGSLKVDE